MPSGLVGHGQAGEDIGTPVVAHERDAEVVLAQGLTGRRVDALAQDLVVAAVPVGAEHSIVAGPDDQELVVDGVVGDVGEIRSTLGVSVGAHVAEPGLLIDQEVLLLGGRPLPTQRPPTQVHRWLRYAHAVQQATVIPPAVASQGSATGIDRAMSTRGRASPRRRMAAARATVDLPDSRSVAGKNRGGSPYAAT